MDEEIGEISLNLSTEGSSSWSEKKKKVVGDRTSRVKQRQEVRQKNNDTRQNSPEADRKRKWEEDSSNKKAASGSDSKKKKSDIFISSLFRKNPEIPAVPSAEVDTVTENVFTGETFKDLPLHPFLISNLEEKQGFIHLTEVQKRAIPVLLKRRDALIKSQTGSGKTLAYAVPIVQSLQSRMVKIKREDGPYAVVIVPTRELALQTYDTFIRLLKTFIWIVPGCLMGGEKRKAEKARLRKGVNILVATPGRLIDHIKTTSVLSLTKVQWLVIDEADRLLELGYERDVAQIINSLKSQCLDTPQTVLLSATLSEGVERLSSITLHNPENISMKYSATQTAHISVDVPASTPLTQSESSKEKDGSFSVPSQLKQHFIIAPCKLRLVALSAFILWKCRNSKPASKMIVFFSTQDSVEFHSKLFSQVLLNTKKLKKTSDLLAESDDVESGYEETDDGRNEVKNSARSSEFKIYRLHGEMLQKERSQTFHEFSEVASGVLLCTDVAARGIDLPNVDWIVQYTSPGATVDYIHRIGRTARAGTKGQSLLFLMPSEVDYLQELNKHKISLSQMQLSAVLRHLLVNIPELPKAENFNTHRQMPRTEEEAATYLQDRAEECVFRDEDMHNLAGKGFQSYVRAYATYSREVKSIFKISDLHLGHVAKSFALREAPTKVHGVTTKFSSAHRKYKRKEKPSKRPQSFKQATLSEYSSGLSSGNKNVFARPDGKIARKRTK